MIELKTPLSEECVARLMVGDVVSISGTIWHRPARIRHFPHGRQPCGRGSNVQQQTGNRI